MTWNSADPDALSPEGLLFPEHLRFDIKGGGAQPPPAEASKELAAWRCEAAKDIAAFANTRGGSILVGAREGTFSIAKYEQIMELAAKHCAEEYVTALKECSPRPVIDPRVIRYENGFVVRVIVEPYPAPPVAVNLGNNTFT